MTIEPVKLTRAEQALLEQIEFDLSIDRHDAAFAQENGEAVCKLMHSLLKHETIPEIRIRVFEDPQYFIGGHGKSHLDVFNKNGQAGDDVFRHVHFLPYLHYFLCGPSLPNEVVVRFCGAVADCGMVTSGDTTTLVGKAKSLTRQYGLDPKRVAEEFYRLALECDLSEGSARTIRENVMRLR